MAFAAQMCRPAALGRGVLCFEIQIASTLEMTQQHLARKEAPKIRSAAQDVANDPAVE